MRVRLVLGILGALIAVGACAPASRPATDSAAASPPASASPSPVAAASPTVAAPVAVKVGIAATSLNFLPAKVAVEHGFYRQYGLDVELVLVGAGVAAAAQMSGELDYSTSYPSAVRSIARGAPLKLVSTVVGAPLFVMLGRPEIGALADLRGQPVGITTRGGAQDKVTHDLLATIGLDADTDVTILPAGGQITLLVDALVNDRIKGAALSAPWFIRARDQGMRVLASAPERIREPQNGLIATDEQLARRRDQVRHMVQAEIEAIRFIQANRAPTTQLISAWLSISPREAEEAYDFVLPAYVPDGTIDVAAMERFLATETEEGNIPPGMKVEQVADLTLAPEAARALAR
ncbi:MAG: ABC transporter substrate-binding protein [Chloroflexi bacterium]|nr:ABC transporter substrate-binding protein [Chloroflexota bacterium]